MPGQFRERYGHIGNPWTRPRISPAGRDATVLCPHVTPPGSRQGAAVVVGAQRARGFRTSVVPRSTGMDGRTDDSLPSYASTPCADNARCCRDQDAGPPRLRRSPQRLVHDFTSRFRGNRAAAAWMSGSGMARDRDVAAFGERAQRYDGGWLGQLHLQIADRTADLAFTCAPAPRRILDVGCGTGYLLGRLAARAPQAEALAGIDAAPAMIAVARGAATETGCVLWWAPSSGCPGQQHPSTWWSARPRSITGPTSGQGWLSAPGCWHLAAALY